MQIEAPLTRLGAVMRENGCTPVLRHKFQNLDRIVRRIAREVDPSHHAPKQARSINGHVDMRGLHPPLRTLHPARLDGLEYTQSLVVRRQSAESAKTGVGGFRLRIGRV